MEENKQENKTNQWETCWAYGGDCGCMILLEMICKEKHCKFHKTPQQFEADAKKYSRKFPY